MAKQNEDPWAEYKDGNCRDVGGQIVPCDSPQAISPPKFPDGHKFATKQEEQAAANAAQKLDD